MATFSLGDAQASTLKASDLAEASETAVFLGEPVANGELRSNRGAGLETFSPDPSEQPSGGLAVILWDEPGQGKPGGGTAGLSGNVAVTVSVGGK